MKDDDKIGLVDIDHRDIIGARNILTKSMYGSLESIHQDETILLEVVK